MGYLDHLIRDGGEYRGMERRTYEGGVESRNVRSSGSGHEGYRHPGPPDFQPGQGRLPGPFHYPGEQLPGEGGLFSGPTRGGGESPRVPQLSQGIVHPGVPSGNGEC